MQSRSPMSSSIVASNRINVYQPEYGLSTLAVALPDAVHWTITRMDNSFSAQYEWATCFPS